MVDGASRAGAVHVVLPWRAGVVATASSPSSLRGTTHFRERAVERDELKPTGGDRDLYHARSSTGQDHGCRPVVTAGLAVRVYQRYYGAGLLGRVKDSRTQGQPPRSFAAASVQIPSAEEPCFAGYARRQHLMLPTRPSVPPCRNRGGRDASHFLHLRQGGVRSLFGKGLRRAGSEHAVPR